MRRTQAGGRELNHAALIRLSVVSQMRADLAAFEFRNRLGTPTMDELEEQKKPFSAKLKDHLNEYFSMGATPPAQLVQVVKDSQQGLVPRDIKKRRKYSAPAATAAHPAPPAVHRPPSTENPPWRYGSTSTGGYFASQKFGHCTSPREAPRKAKRASTSSRHYLGFSRGKPAPSREVASAPESRRQSSTSSTFSRRSSAHSVATTTNVRFQVHHGKRNSLTEFGDMTFGLPEKFIQKEEVPSRRVLYPDTNGAKQQHDEDTVLKTFIARRRARFIEGNFPPYNWRKGPANRSVGSAVLAQEVKNLSSIPC